jgi:hypothetical protein
MSAANRIAAVLTAHTAHSDGHIIILDIAALRDALVTLFDEHANEAVVDALREHTSRS